MKKATIIIVVSLLSFAFITTDAVAGSKQRHRWEGVAIGVGAAILGSAIIHNSRRPHYRDRAPAPVYYKPSCRQPERRPRYRNHRSDHRRGHWETRRVWHEPVYEKVWNPGHYNRRNRWIPGKWIRIEREPGYWEEERVWVSHR